MISRKIRGFIVLLAIGALAFPHALLAQVPQGTPSPADPWPREITLANAKAILYQPQIESWEENKRK